MRTLPLNPALLGRRLARTVHDRSGRPLLAAGTVLAAPHLDALARRGVARVALQDPLFPDLTPDYPVSEETWLRVRTALAAVFDAASQGRGVALDRLDAAVADLLDDLRRRRPALLSLADAPCLDDEHLDHAINVCLLALVLGQARSRHRLDLHKLALGAVLHDVGKVVPPGVVSASADGDLWRAHAEVGFEYLRSCCGLSPLAAHMAFQHHECLDGSGYPRGLRGTAIHEFGLIGAVANACAHLLAAPRDPAAARARLHALAGRQLDADLVAEALARVALHPVGTVVTLSDGSIGVVAAQTLDPARPRVRVVADGAGRPRPPEEVDLFQRLDLTVTAALPDYPPEVLAAHGLPVPPAGT